MQKNTLDYTLIYSNWHKNNKESLKSDMQQYHTLIELHNLLPKNKTSKILELGCGMGRFLLALQDMGCTNLKGIDINPDFISIGKKEGIDLIQADCIEYLENTEEKYDVIYCLDVLEHLPKEQQPDFFKLLYEKINNEGFIVIRVPNALAPTANFFRYDDFTHVISYTPLTIDCLAKNAGFNYTICRPEFPEDEELLLLKAPYAQIFKLQFGLDNLILTPNIVTIISKSKDFFEKYIDETPPIINNYNLFQISSVKLNELFTYYILKFAQKFSFGILKKYINSKLTQSYKIAVIKRNLF